MFFSNPTAYIIYLFIYLFMYLLLHNAANRSNFIFSNDRTISLSLSWVVFYDIT
jgi:hypothetical protein